MASGTSYAIFGKNRKACPLSFFVMTSVIVHRLDFATRGVLFLAALVRGIPVSLLDESAKWYVFGFTPFAFVRAAVEIRTSHVPPNGHLLIIIQREQASSLKYEH